MENRGLSADSGFIDRSASIHVRSTIQEQIRGFSISIFGRDVQKCCSSKEQASRARLATVELGEPPVDQLRVRIDLVRQPIEAATKQVENTRRVVFCNAAGFQKSVNAFS